MSEYSGHENLEAMSNTKNFNDWMYSQIHPSLKGDILEVGSGLGVFSEKIIKDFPNSSITLSEISDMYIKNLKKKFLKSNITICKLDLNLETDYEKIGYKKFDSIFAINVLEHVERDEFALEQFYRMLKQGGNLIILVPANKFLFNVIDKQIGHFRRYSKQELELKIHTSKFKINRLYFFNIIGILGWFVNGNLLKKSNINTKSVSLFDKIIPIEKNLEKLLKFSFGLSIICHATKK